MANLFPVLRSFHIRALGRHGISNVYFTTNSLSLCQSQARLQFLCVSVHSLRMRIFCVITYAPFCFAILSNQFSTCIESLLLASYCVPTNVESLGSPILSVLVIIIKSLTHYSKQQITIIITTTTNTSTTTTEPLP